MHLIILKSLFNISHYRVPRALLALSQLCSEQTTVVLVGGLKTLRSTTRKMALVSREQVNSFLNLCIQN